VPAAARILLLSALCALAGAADQAPHRLRVVAFSPVVFDILRHVGGDRVEAQCLLRPGTDAHAYLPVPEDARRLAGADLVILNGLGFEGWADALLTESQYAGRVAIASQGVAPLPMPNARGGAAVDDPHAFNDLANGVRYAENIRDALVALDPDGADDYRAWAEAYVAQLRQLDGWVKRQVARIPADGRRLVTDHDALQYFAKAYGFSVLAPGTATEDAQPGAQEVARIVALIQAQGIKGVFLERDKNPKLVEQIAREAGVRIGGELWLDGPAPAGCLADSYQGMFLANVRTIVRTLE
jgi:zinc/manganese transport system substrate-binding protein